MVLSIDLSIHSTWMTSMVRMGSIDREGNTSPISAGRQSRDKIIVAMFASFLPQKAVTRAAK